jgi:hypothetical protein
VSTAEWRNQRHHKLAGVEMDHDEDCPVCKKYGLGTPERRAFIEEAMELSRRQQAERKHDQ